MWENIQYSICINLSKFQRFTVTVQRDLFINYTVVLFGNTKWKVLKNNEYMNCFHVASRGVFLNETVL